jgi:rare lipoprotein A
MKTTVLRHLGVSLSTIVALVSFSLAGAAENPKSKSTPNSKSTSNSNSNDQAAGKATIYSDKFAGKKTATGETYKPQQMTAASNKLPLGSKVIVKNKKTGKKAVVKITDRMSKHSSAVIDLSKGAANKIGVKGTGEIQASKVNSTK